MPQRPCSSIVTLLVALMVLPSCKAPVAVGKPSENADRVTESIVDDFMKTHSIDSIETDQEKRNWIRSEVAKGKIKRDPATGKVKRVD